MPVARAQVSTLKPHDLVSLLDRVWSKYDELADKHDVQKMETVGATYMAVGGLHRDGSQPVEILQLGLECIEECAQFAQPDGTPIKVRIGMNCGSVLSGVVGTKKPQFSLFGDTVNTAARMQSTGEPMHVHMSGFAKASSISH